MAQAGQGVLVQLEDVGSADAVKTSGCLGLLGCDFRTQQVRCYGHWCKVVPGKMATGKTNQLIPMAVG